MQIGPFQGSERLRDGGNVKQHVIAREEQIKRKDVNSEEKEDADARDHYTGSRIIILCADFTGPPTSFK